MHDRIGTLRTRGAARDAPALRGAAERALAGLTLAPPTLPDAAILCLRRVQVRADLQQALHGRSARQASVQQQAAAAWSAAARPARGPVSLDSAAVWFADEAELLACLAQDLLLNATQAWWWAALLGPAVDAHAVQRRWLAQAAAVPAALQQLAARGLAAALLRSWPAAFCSQLAAQLAGWYGVSSWPPAPTLGTVATPRGQQDRPADAAAPGRLAGPAGWPALWQHCPGLHGLPLPQQQMWALATLLARAPALASQPGVAASLQAELDRGPAHTASAGGPPVTADGSADAVAARLPRAAGNLAVADRMISPDDALARQAPSGKPQQPAGPTPSLGAATARQPLGAAAATSGSQSTAHPQADADFPAPPAMPGTRPSTADATAATATLPRPLLSARSQHAGLLYVLRLAMQLGLYADFTQPRQPGIALPPADWLALVGLRLFGPAFQLDPLWPLLAAWAGRAPGDAPAQGFVPATGQALTPWLDAQIRGCQRLARQALPRQRQALRWLCQRPGRWVLSSSRLDAYFALAGHPLAIRQAGLDRDPGWLPAAGLAVWLHFD